MLWSMCRVTQTASLDAHEPFVYVGLIVVYMLLTCPHS